MEIHLIPDKTALIQLATFLIVLAGLSGLVFLPIKKIIAARRDKTGRLIEEADKIKQQIETASEKYRSMIEEARLNAAAEKEKIRREALKEESKIKAEAKEETARIINNARAGIAAAKEEAVSGLRKELPRLADEILKKIKS